MIRLNLLAFSRALPLVLGCAASASAAQTPTSTQDRLTSATRPRGDAARSDAIFRHTVSCVVEREPSRTRNLLQTIPGTSGEASLIGSFRSRLNWCVPALDSIGFSWNLLRGGMAEVFYHRGFPSGLPRTVVPATEQTAAWARPRVEQRRITALEGAHASARCVVLRQPGLVSDLLASGPFSAAEVPAIRALQPDISACVDAGVKFAANRQSLRALLAEAALHYGEARRNGFREIARMETGPR